MKRPSQAVRGWAEEELTALSRQGLFRELEPFTSSLAPRVKLGDGKPLLNFSSNDYLGLANDSRLVEAARQGLAQWGCGGGASRLVVGGSLAHQALETRLAKFKHAEAALVFNSGYAANTGVLPAVVGEGDVVFSDAWNHASLVDGCRLSKAKTVVYPHADVGALDQLLASTPGRRKLVCTDAVFSMDGDLAPLAQLVSVCQAHGAGLYVDEAHATGVLGSRGAGLCESLGLQAQVDLRMGTLGKALGVFGAYVVGPKEAISLLVNRARPFVFSTALPSALCAAAERSIDLVEQDENLRSKLWKNIRALTEGLQHLGISARAQSPIFPIIVGAPERAVALSGALREKGLLVKAIRPPTVPQGTSRLRIAVSAAHEDAHIDQLLGALRALEVSCGG
jgi:8-amino-7-oxononanoate synthase